MEGSVTENGAGRFGSTVEDLAWIEEFAQNVRAFVRVRLEDSVLIKVPIEVHKLNPTGADLLNRALEGGSAAEIVEATGATGRPDRIFRIHAFFCDVRDLLSGRLGDGRARLAVDTERFTGSTTTYPVLSEVALTYRCNLACRFCYAGCGGADAGPGPSGPEMTTAEAERVLEILARDAKVPSVSFTGGEATLRPDLPRLIAHARSLGMRVNLITNGVRCASEEYAVGLAAAGLHSAQVSIEGPDAETHDSLTTRPGSFVRSLAGLGNLRAAGISAHPHTTISGSNAARAVEMVDLAVVAGAPRLTMNMIIPTGTPGLESNREHRLSYAGIGRFALAVRDRAAAAGIEFHWYSPTPFCVFNPIAKGLGNKGCAACDGLIHVSPTGDVLPCSSYDRSVGNLLTESFDEVWFGARACFHREKRHAPAECAGCEDFALCQGACPLYWRTMGTELLAFRREAREVHR